MFLRPYTEQFVRTRELRRRGGLCHQTGPCIGRRLEQFCVPAEMFACDSQTGLFAVKGIDGLQMRQNYITAFRSGERFRQLTPD